MRVGILRGGAGKHYKSSLEKGGNIIAHILENLAPRHKPVDILIDKYGQWHLGGLPISPEDLKHKVDVVWNVSHPSTHQYLDNFSIPSTHASRFFSVLEHNPDMLREHVKHIGLGMPRAIILPAYQEDFDGPKGKYALKKAKEIFEKFGAPWIVKSFTPESTMGMHVAKTFPELVSAIEDGVHHGKSILVEELIPGKVAGLHTLSGFRGENIYVFPPGAFSNEEKEILVSTARELHNHLAAGHYLKSDFVITPRKKVILLGVDSIPDLREDSHFYQACQSVGVKTHDVVEHILERVLKS